MDSNAGELAHAIEEVTENVEKEPLHSLGNDELRGKKVSREKSGVDSSSSEGSSDDGHQLEKPDSHMVNVEDVKDDEEAYAHLPPHERDIVKKQLEMSTVKVSYMTIFRYATRNDILIIIASSICGIAAGAVQPLMTVSCHLCKNYANNNR